MPNAPRLLAVGDIADCASADDEAVAALVGAREGSVALLGDTVYASGTADEFANCFLPAWGGIVPRSRPAAGNHDYGTAGAAPYFATFGAAAGRPSEGWYSYELGAWHVVVLNSNCWAVGGCGQGSPQERWLRADLAAHPAACTLAYWHHPVFSSGLHGPDSGGMSTLWGVLYAAGADVVLNGHDHHYERFGPLDAAGRPDPVTGVREFIVGTGGAQLYPVLAEAPGSEIIDYRTHGVLELTLHADGFDWQFLPASGRSRGDSGAAACHGAP